MQIIIISHTFKVFFGCEANYNLHPKVSGDNYHTDEIYTLNEVATIREVLQVFCVPLIWPHSPAHVRH